MGRSACFFDADVQQAANEVCIIADYYDDPSQQLRFLRSVSAELLSIVESAEKELLATRGAVKMSECVRGHSNDG